MIKKLLLALALPLLLLQSANAQDTSQYIGLTVKRTIWFYPNTISKTSRYSVKAQANISYLPLPDRIYFPALHDSKKGFVESAQVTDEFQNYGQSGKVELHITGAGSKIRRGANSVLAGTLIAVAGVAVGTLFIKDDQGMQDAVTYGAGGLGFLLMITGYGSIAKGGRDLEGYRGE